MNLEHLRYFLVLSEYEHYGKAAEALCISQPGLSHAIASMEANFGVQLFRKTGRNIELTIYGEMLKKSGNEIVTMANQCENLFLQIQNGGGTLNICGVLPVMGMVIPKLVKQFQKEINPEGEFRFFTGSTKDILDGVRSGTYDLGFCSRAEWGDEIDAKPFQKQQMVAIMEPNHMLAKRKQIKLADTLPFPQIVFSKTSALRPVMQEFFGKIDATPKVAYEVEQDEVIAEMAACGFGLAVMPKLPSVWRTGLSVLPIASPIWENSFYIIRRIKEYSTKLEEQFFQYGKNYAFLQKGSE